MNIGIIGAGHIGSTLARKFSAGGHAVKLAGSKGPEEVREKAEMVGAVPVDAREAVKDVDVVVLSIPFAKLPEVADFVATVPPGTVVIDTSNYYPMRDGHIDEVDNGKPESVWASEQLGRSVVKAFNAALAQTLAEEGRPPGTAGRIAMPIASDDAKAMKITELLVDLAGFDPVDAGDLANSWRLQPGTPAYCTELRASELVQALAAADKSLAPSHRDALIREFMRSETPPDHALIVRRNRAVTAHR